MTSRGWGRGGVKEWWVLRDQIKTSPGLCESGGTEGREVDSCPLITQPQRLQGRKAKGGGRREGVWDAWHSVWPARPIEKRSTGSPRGSRRRRQAANQLPAQRLRLHSTAVGVHAWQDLAHVDRRVGTAAGPRPEGSVSKRASTGTVQHLLKDRIVAGRPGLTGLTGKGALSGLGTADQLRVWTAASSDAMGTPRICFRRSRRHRYEESKCAVASAPHPRKRTRPSFRTPG
ncbi:hypothetical protein BDZ91DRAFT_787338 [Kalaharituber pfeilii]|nr:hypothetical protein BDZ91DRAFT_787338 [Kalaharituber pfeilii]